MIFYKFIYVILNFSLALNIWRIVVLNFRSHTVVNGVQCLWCDMHVDMHTIIHLVNILVEFRSLVYIKSPIRHEETYYQNSSPYTKQWWHIYGFPWAIVTACPVFRQWYSQLHSVMATLCGMITTYNVTLSHTNNTVI